MFLNSLAAQTAGASTGGWQMLLPLVLVFGVMYFLIIRPQNKRMKDQQTMQSSVKVGDTVATSGGLIGRVTKVDDKEIHVDFNRSGHAVRVLKTAIVGVLDSPNKAKAMTQTQGSVSSSTASEKAETKSDKPQQKARPRSPMNRGRTTARSSNSNNQRSAPAKSEE